MKMVFISYAHEDLDQAKKIYKRLKSVPDIEPWLDKECLLPGMKWKPAIRKSIRESRYFITLLSKHSINKKGYCQKELKEALDILDEFPEDQIFVIPIRLDDIKPHSEKLQEIQYVDFFPSWNKGFKRVLKVISAIDKEAKKKSIVKRKVKAKIVTKKYEYKCGIVDFDIDFDNLKQITNRLNRIQKYFYFTPLEIDKKINAVKSYDGLLNLSVNSIPTSFYKLDRNFDVDLVICLTKYPLAFEEELETKFNYFSGPSRYDERYMFVSTDSLYNFTYEAKCTFERGIVYIMISQLLVYFTDLYYHEKTLGCVMDFCEKRSDMVKGLKKMKLCSRCFPKIEDSNLEKSIMTMLSDDMTI